MSVTGIASSILSGLSSSHSGQSRSQQVRAEFKQLAEDLQSGNLSQAQQDFTALSKDLTGVSQSGSQTISSSSSSAGSTTSTNPFLQAFNQLGQDLQSGNLQAAQQDLTKIEQTAHQNVQPNAQQAEGHHHYPHHHVEHSQESSSSSASQQMGAIAQAFRQLSQTLQAGNLQGSQQAFSMLQNDLQQIGGFVTAGSAGASSGAASTSAGSLNVSA